MPKLDDNKWNQALSGREMIEPFNIKYRGHLLEDTCNVPGGVPDHPHCIHFEVDRRTTGGRVTDILKKDTSHLDPTVVDCMTKSN